MKFIANAKKQIIYVFCTVPVITHSENINTAPNINATQQFPIRAYFFKKKLYKYIVGKTKKNKISCAFKLIWNEQRIYINVKKTIKQYACCFDMACPICPKIDMNKQLDPKNKSDYNGIF